MPRRLDSRRLAFYLAAHYVVASACPAGGLIVPWISGVMNSKPQELALLAALACLGLGLALAQGEGTFAAVFAVEATAAVLGAVYLSMSWW